MPIHFKLGSTLGLIMLFDWTYWLCVLNKLVANPCDTQDYISVLNKLIANLCNAQDYITLSVHDWEDSNYRNESFPSPLASKRYVHQYLLHFIKFLSYSIEAHQNIHNFLIKADCKAAIISYKNVQYICTTISAKETRNAIYIHT